LLILKLEFTKYLFEDIMSRCHDNDAKIREASVNDIDEVYLIERLSFHEQEVYPKDLLKFYLSIAPKTFLVAEVGGKIVGYVIAVIRRGYIGHIVSIAVNPSFRGKGFGKLLMIKIEETLKILGCAVLRLEVKKTNIVARNLYLKIGFVEAYEVPNYYFNGCDAIVMFKLLPECRQTLV
jgi:ribosomal-protein-alanine N-acetyltransferase